MARGNKIVRDLRRRTILPSFITPLRRLNSLRPNLIVMHRYRHFHNRLVLLDSSRFVVKKLSLLCTSNSFLSSLNMRIIHVHLRGRRFVRGRTCINREGAWVVRPGRTRNRTVRISRLYGRNGSCCGYDNLRRDPFLSLENAPHEYAPKLPNVQ